MTRPPRPGFMEQIERAKINVANTARSSPFVYNEGCELANAARALTEAQYRYNRAKKAWDQLIAAADNGLPDPLKEK